MNHQQESSNRYLAADEADSTGIVGPKGDKGDPGPPGPQGEKGEKGDSGFAGLVARGASLTGDGTEGAPLEVVYGMSAGTACQGNDARLSNARIPTIHAATHKTGGSDALVPADIGALASNATAAAATKLATARTIGGVFFDGTANINLPGVNADGNQNTTGNAATATKLATARTLRTNLASTETASFDGSANIVPGITGVLPTANGGSRVVVSGTVGSTGTWTGIGVSSVTRTATGVYDIVFDGSYNGLSVFLTASGTSAANAVALKYNGLTATGVTVMSQVISAGSVAMIDDTFSLLVTTRL